jgi:hypothetical protein
MRVLPKADNDDFDRLSDEQRAALEECLRLLKEAEAMIARKLYRTEPRSESQSS